MDIKRERDFYTHISKQVKNYVCAECGTYTMVASKTTFKNDYESEVILKCNQCNWEQKREISYFDY